ncbi:MAG: SDR family NAD(P)-dependent oxidoreductase [Betaproteobacteria bacterium]|nr:SDR family NAD(P)-dependent oxidoreductase [Betaproteobacteria bacterium]
MEKVVIVTGAGGWLGSGVAMAFGRAGDKVLINDVDEDAAAEVAAAINKQGPGQAVAFPASVTQYKEVAAMVERALALWGRVDVMVCVAGGALGRLTRGREKEKLITEYSDEDWDLVVDTNLKGIFHCIKAAAAPMSKQRDGHIIIMGSGTGSKGRARWSAYAASKAGVLGLMKAAALELGEHNVKVNVVAPGKNPHPGEADTFAEGNILKRTNHPDEVGEFFVHLSRMKSVSGQFINLDARILF